ncbi:hypothetical protein [Allosphingosinicella sp.]|jgi:hypothetical protein|uniref:hypothetical protein n=1 Tax=Allosphingosinicella sp. TaxID=2823234 RepID=UPI002F027CB7
MNNVLRLGGVAVIAVGLSACATITRGTKQDYVIETDPAGAQIALSTGQECVSPCRLRLPRKHDFVVTATSPGYDTATVQVESSMRAGGGAAMAGNAIFGGLIGGAVDASNGSLKDLRPNPLRIAMVPTGSAPAAAEAPVAAEEAPADPAAAAPAAAPAEGAAPAEAPVPTTPQEAADEALNEAAQAD